MSKVLESWCNSDNHDLFENFRDFNDWIDSRESDAAQFCNRFGLDNLAHPSKGFYAGDKEAYDQAFQQFHIERMHDVLSKEAIVESFGDDHWFRRNKTRFDQMVARLMEESVVPFIGAGVSVAGGFPTWKNHLREQGKTAGIESAVIESFLENGAFEELIEQIENTCGKDVFAQEIRDAFSKTGNLEDITLRISELFSDTLITTNYDRLLEQSFDVGPDDEVQVVNGLNAMESPDANKVTVIKLHGDIRDPHRCILGKNQYDEAYGAPELDLSRPIPKLLRYYYRTSSLLFIGCSLNNDRTIQVFQAVKESIGDVILPQHFSIEQAPLTLEDLRKRNTELLNIGITPIWFPAGEFDKVEAVLRHARNEVNYRKTK